ncbi:MAG: hypothetical protein U0934_15945 [Pseudotabrizicola sp.]|uniref:hypothetical protein n=1 Tax=Pseudotabrizicola sp. TaxID=2939647 RepID=UPI00271EE2E1|nr:hypothetical protein [Pseudotabrizicola sp.]MDO8881579.1 hypothetical protein [Pseudotabrizicola sp.]MDP2079975.1 hypothetical protein [Pseudotabrizicola sp.]MDZ7575420.1 hypothetical protein [Pseudotabrizicola sp.]
MTQTLFAFSLGAAGLILAATAGHSATQCGKRDMVLGQLTEKYGETRRSIGVAASNGVMEVFASDTSGSWTITVTRPDGLMCLVASGQGFETITEQLPAKGAKI